MNLDTITTPTLLLDKKKTLDNIQSIVQKCNNNQIAIRPHFKTHQSLEVGRWFRQHGIEKITVSSVRMAEYFASDGWKDILIAFPFNPREIENIHRLAERVTLTLIVPCVESANLLSELCEKKVKVMIEIDTGYGRSGTLWNDTESLSSIITNLEANTNISVKGLLSHSGHTYKAGDIDKVKSIYKEGIERMQECKRNLENDDLIISVGDTPSASIVGTLDGADELRPGNFVFYDVMQYMIGSCILENIAVALACPVVDISRDRCKAVIYGGGVHLSKESILHNSKPIFGIVVKLTNDGWVNYNRDIFLTSLSQEHGIIKCEDPLPEDIIVGGLVGILPVHSCLTADLMAEYTLLDGSRIDHLNRPNS